jgi:hypothetical protein
MTSFKSEIDRRKAIYFSQKEKKEKTFREIEKTKTQLRIIENRSEKGLKSKSINFPIKLDAGIISGVIASDQTNLFPEVGKEEGKEREYGIVFMVQSGGI